MTTPLISAGQLVAHRYDSGASQQLNLERLANPLHELFPAGLDQELSRISQWGLKEVWLSGRIGGHNRWEHSKGTLTAGLIWLDALQQHEAVPRHLFAPPLTSWRQVTVLLGTALLLHDYGHTPFSHVMEQVLSSINWIPAEDGSHSPETIILRQRLNSAHLTYTWPKLASHLGCQPQEAQEMVAALVCGQFGIPWLQAIANSPLDADKIDYLCLDTQQLRDTPYSVGTRLLTGYNQWLTDFLADQHVNHAGLLCLHGRSALAAADLWRERMFLYDRFYLSPQLRAAERMAFEILQQFAIRVVMSPRFRNQLSQELQKMDPSLSIPDFLSSLEADSKPRNLIKQKFELVVMAGAGLAHLVTGQGAEFPILELVYRLLAEDTAIDEAFRGFLGSCFSQLRDLKDGKTDLRAFAAKVLVREPLVIPRHQFRTAQDALRPLQHIYCRDVLIDIIALPSVLAWPPAWKRSWDGRSAAMVLVPRGPVSSWGFGSRASSVLGEEAVSELDRPYGRVLVIAPGGPSARTEFIWDRVSAALAQAGVRLLRQKGLRGAPI